MQISEAKLRKVAEEVLAHSGYLDEEQGEEIVEELMQRAADEAEDE
jgi:polyhydroxyalkanoate synthesis regulator phasin